MIAGRRVRMKQPSNKKIASIIGNKPLASAINSSVALALDCSFVHLAGGKTVWSIFEHSLDAAIRHIVEHERGRLFQRLIDYGPHNPEAPEALTSDDKTFLSDPECGLCVEFIYSHMINRFKGELSELLALEPCIKLVQRLQQNGQLPADVHLYWGEIVLESRQNRIAGRERDARRSSFTKGADGLLVKQMPIQHGKTNLLKVHGVVEVKSMTQPMRKVLGQIDSHSRRLGGGIKLDKKEWSPDNMVFPPLKNIKKDDSNFIRVVVFPSIWNLSRKWHSVKIGKGKEKMFVFPESPEPPMQTQVEQLGAADWKITLAWSQEALNQAAYEMTFWYMSQVGRHVYTKKHLPRGWKLMTPEQAGCNSIKMMLYYIPLRYISKRQERLAVRLYNVYCFGYPLGVDSKEMLWPEGFPDKDG